MLARVELGGHADTGPPRHAERLAPAIEYCCEQIGASLDHVSAIAVGIGPGMFTGLRVGVTTAKVLAQALRIPMIPVPSLDLLAYPLRHAHALVVPAIDARRNELYYALYRAVPGGVQRASEYEVGTPDDLVAELEARGEEALLCGDGALRFALGVRRRRARRARGPGPCGAQPRRAGRVGGGPLPAGRVLHCRRRAALVPAQERRRARLGPEGPMRWRRRAR